MKRNPFPVFDLILAWYDRDGRRLPWRETHDPYEILVSEIMLQQTQVSRVIPFYRNWLKQFPDWKSLAAASPEAVIRAWSGLGYNRRALMLQHIASAVAAGGVPASEQDWLALKGIGPYTAAALTVFALQERAIPIDTNIRRIGGRLCLGIPWPEAHEDPEISSKLGKVIEKKKRFDDFFQALFDLASLICTKKPLCSSCPLSQTCLAFPWFQKHPEEKPPARRKPSRERIHRNKPHPDRIFRGRILKLAGSEKRGVSERSLGPLIDSSFDETQDTKWLNDMVQRLIQDGLLSRRNGRLVLPSGS